MEDLRYPVLWIGHIVRGQPEFWKEINEINIPNFGKFNVKSEVLNNVIMNAYDLYTANVVNEISERGGIKKWLGENVNYVMVDSGGFLFQRKGILSISPDVISGIYVKIKPDVCVALDHPLDPTQSKFDNIDRIKLTLKNTEKMVHALPSSLKFIPAVHGYTPEMLLACLTEMMKIFDKAGREPFMFGLGSLVPLMRSIPNMRNYYFEPWGLNSARKTAIKIAHEFRTLLKGKRIHAFGIGYNMMHLLLLLGFDSVDSIGWRMAGARGQILIFNKGARAISPRASADSTWSKPISPEEFKQLEEYCNCPVCSSDPNKLREDETARMLHNAYVFLQEALAARILINEGIDEYIYFLKERFSDMQTKPLFDYAVDLINQSKTVIKSSDFKKEYDYMFKYSEEDKILDREEVLDLRNEIESFVNAILPIISQKIGATNTSALKMAILNSVNWRLIRHVDKNLFKEMILDVYLPFIKLEYFKTIKKDSKELLPFLLFSNNILNIREDSELSTVFLNSLSKKELEVLKRCKAGKKLEQLSREIGVNSNALKEIIDRLMEKKLIIRKNNRYSSVIDPDNLNIIQDVHDHIAEKVELIKREKMFEFIWKIAGKRLSLEGIIDVLKHVKDKGSISNDDAEKKFGSHWKYVIKACHKINLLRHHRKLSKHYEFPVLKAKKLARLIDENAKQNLRDYIIKHPLFSMFVENMLIYISLLRKTPTLDFFQK